MIARDQRQVQVLGHAHPAPEAAAHYGLMDRMYSFSTLATKPAVKQ